MRMPTSHLKSIGHINRNTFSPSRPTLHRRTKSRGARRGPERRISYNFCISRNGTTRSDRNDKPRLTSPSPSLSKPSLLLTDSCSFSFSRVHTGRECFIINSQDTAELSGRPLLFNFSVTLPHPCVPCSSLALTLAYLNSFPMYYGRSFHLNCTVVCKNEARRFVFCM